jgi:hypothetical protein
MKNIKQRLERDLLRRVRIYQHPGPLMCNGVFSSTTASTYPGRCGAMREQDEREQTEWHTWICIGHK